LTTSEAYSGIRTIAIGRGGDTEVEGRGDQDGDYSNQEQRSIQLSSSRLDSLFCETNTTGKETPTCQPFPPCRIDHSHSEDEEQVTQDRTNQRRLYDGKFTFDQSEDSDDKFDYISQSRIEETTEGLT
jgi:hypothetical protein